MQFADHFSRQAQDYADYRPHYPPALFDWLAQQAPSPRRAWDAGCGNGQASVALAGHFEQVIASDPSAAQIAAATPHPRIDYRVAAAEEARFAAGSLDLICVAQALHWFDPARFHPLARAALADGGVIAAISYGLCRVNAEVDAVFDQLYEDILGPYWPAERVQVENGYRDLPFPWDEQDSIPEFAMQPRWDLAGYRGYLGSWSALQRYRQQHGDDPRERIDAALAKAWGDPQQRRAVHFPLRLRVGRKR